MGVSVSQEAGDFGPGGNPSIGCLVIMHIQLDLMLTDKENCRRQAGSLQCFSGPGSFISFNDERIDLSANSASVREADMQKRPRPLSLSLLINEMFVCPDSREEAIACVPDGSYNYTRPLATDLRREKTAEANVSSSFQKKRQERHRSDFDVAHMHKLLKLICRICILFWCYNDIRILNIVHTAII